MANSSPREPRRRLHTCEGKGCARCAEIAAALAKVAYPDGLDVPLSGATIANLRRQGRTIT